MTGQTSSIDKRIERRWVWMFALLVLTATTLPYLIGYSQQGEDWRFTGFVFGVSDGNSYIAKMMIGASGSWLFRIPYTAYSQDGVLLFLPYILLGKLAAPPGLHEQLVALFHIFRITAGFMAIHATYDFISIFVTELRWRRWATVLAILGGGLGWLSMVGLSRWFAWGLPLESYSPEAFGFLSIYGLPHLAAARAMLLWSLRRFLIGSESKSRLLSWVKTAALWVGMWIFQPIIQFVGVLVVAIFLLITGAWLLWFMHRQDQSGWKTWKNYCSKAVQIFVVSAPAAIYLLLVIKLNPIYQMWESQNFIGAPPPLTYLLGYGIVLPLALVGILTLLRHMPWHGSLLTGWLIFIPVLVYAPLSFQRRLMDGIWVVITILAFTFIAIAGARLRKLALGWLLLAFPITIIIFSSGFWFTLNPGKPLFRPVDEVLAFEYLAKTVNPGDVVLAADDSSNPMPAWVPVRTILGHGPESLNGKDLRKRVTCFYNSDCQETDRLTLLEEFSVDFILWGPGEQELGNWDPIKMPQMEQVYRTGDYFVYKYHSPTTP